MFSLPGTQEEKSHLKCARYSFDLSVDQGEVDEAIILDFEGEELARYNPFYSSPISSSLFV